MSDFVEECRKEWARLHVPDADANEMASDLEADLAEAQAEGASPEEVLGNGYFDAKSFAASWAFARGVVNAIPPDRRTVQVRTLVLALGTLAGVLIAAAGLLILVRPRYSSSQAVAVAPFARRVGRPLPSILVNPHQFFFGGPSSAIDPLGWFLLALGVIGLVVTLWVWRPFSIARPRAGMDQNIGMPSFL